MKLIKAVHFDADGVLIKGGDFYSTPSELKEAISEMRDSGVLFNMASGRPLFEQEELFKIITNNAEPKEQEGILYEASAVKLWHSDEKHQVGGLDEKQIDQIESYLMQHGLVTGMVPQQNNRKYETKTGYVTPSFRTEGVTDERLLKSTYERVKPVIESEFPFSQVEMSADAIDIMAKGVSKDKNTIKYSQLTGISLEETAAIGDSGGDMAMLREIVKNDGKVSFVGDNDKYTKELSNYGNNFFKTTELNQQGAVQFVRQVIDYNKQF